MDRIKYLGIEYCQETVIIQSAFLLAGKMMNLEQSLQKHEFVAVVKIIQRAINEISEGLSITKAKNTVLPIETYALHRKIHLWLYKAWRNCRSSSSTDAGFLESFPALPKFGTGLYVLIVEEMGWELLLAECLINTHEEVLPFVLQDIVATTISFQDSGFFTLLFDCLLPSFASKQSCHTNCSTLVQVLLEGLTSLCEYITDKNQQLHVIKRLIDFVFQGFQCHMKEHSNTCSVHQIEMERKRLVVSGEEVKSDSVVHIDSTIEDKHGSRSADNELTCWCTDSNVLYCLKVLMKLFTDQWKDICNWTTDNKDDIGQMDSALWHPLHQWILKLYGVLGFIINATTFNASQDSRMWLFYNGLAVYIDANAATSESEWLCNQQKGFMSDGIDLNSLENEQIDMSGPSKTFMFTHGSLEEQLDDAIWRVKHNLEGSLDSLNWLLTTEELFDNPSWLQCIKDNVVKMGHKDQAIMMVDILCVQRQIIESAPEYDNGGFDIIKELVIALFNDLSMPDQEELIKYAFSMSLVSALDVTCDSVFFHPTQLQKDKKKLQDDLQVLFNKLVDSSLVSAFKRQVRSIKQLSFLSPYITLYKALQLGVQYGQTTTIVKIFQEIPVLCFLCSNGTTIPLLCEILASIATELPSKQEENNLIKLVQMLLQRYRNAHLPGTSQPLLEKSNLFTTCILPFMNLHGNKKPIPTKTALKLLKTTMNTIDLKNQTEKAFVLRYLIPIVLALCRLLSDCKVDWEEMGSNPMNVVELRSLVLVNLEESIHVMHSMFQRTPTGLIHPLEWLHNKLLTIGWTAVLYIKPLLELLPTKRQYSIPKCVIEFCDLPTESWTPCVNGSDYNVVDCLFECCVISDTISSQMVDALEKKSWSSVDISLKEQVIRKLSQVMSFITWSEMSRIVSLCTILIRKVQISLELFSVHDKTPLSSLPDLPANLNGIVVMSSIQHQVFKLLLKPNTVMLGNVIKLYVSTIKQMCQVLLTDPGLDKYLSSDVIARMFDDLCHVVCIVPLEDTDPLFILALDIASMVSGRHVVSLKQSVAMVPKSVYTESLVQKLETRMLVQ